jgi:hypothetical protein
MVTATETARTTETLVSYSLAWAPDTKRQFAKGTIRPEMLNAQYIDGRLNTVSLAGAAVLKNGNASTVRHWDRYYADHRRDRADLEWMWELVPPTLDDELHEQILETVEVMSDPDTMAATREVEIELGQAHEEWAWTYVIAGANKPQPWNHARNRWAAEHELTTHGERHPNDRLILGRRTIHTTGWQEVDRD